MENESNNHAEQEVEEMEVVLVDVYGFPITQEQAENEPFMAEFWF
jgi:hypothetical protein